MLFSNLSLGLTAFLAALLQWEASANPVIGPRGPVSPARPVQPPAPGQHVTGSPAPGNAVPCEKVSKFTTQFFHNEVVYHPPKDTCLFYTEYLSASAKKFAQHRVWTTIWNIWPAPYYEGKQIPSNPLRCIFKEPADRTLYFENMSRAMAELCDGDVAVMTKDPANIPQNGIWARVEEPTLKKTGNPGGQCNLIEVFKTNGKSCKVLWTRTGHSKRLEVEERAPAKHQCGERNGHPDPKKPDPWTPEQIDEWFGMVRW